MHRFDFLPLMMRLLFFFFFFTVEALAQQLSAGVKDTRGLSLPPIFPQQAAGLSAYRV